MDILKSESNDVLATLKFLASDPKHKSEKPFTINYTPHYPLPEKNFDEELVENIPIKDIRPIKNTLNLDEHGVSILDLNSKMAYEDYFDVTKIKEIYVHEIRALLLQSLGARQIYFHECVIRKRSTAPSSAVDTTESKNEVRYGRPVQFAHADYTLAALTSLVRDLSGEKADAILQRRYQALNVWKPLRGPLKDWPLAWADICTFDAERDMVPADRVYIDGVVESYWLRHNEGQRWCYLADQRDDEAILFRSSDSAGGMAVPHASFDNPLCPDGEDARESVELRILALY